MPGISAEESLYKDTRAPYYNWYTADLTGYAVHGKAVGSSVLSTAIDDFRVSGEVPMKPGDRRMPNIRAHRIQLSYDEGAAYHPESAIAAIFADGTTFGDRSVLSVMIEYRRSMIGALTNIETTLCTLGTQRASISEVNAALSKQHAAEDARSASDKDARGAAYTHVDKGLNGRSAAHQPPDRVIKQTWERLNKLRSGLADPVKGSLGQLLIPPVMPLACNLP